MPGQDRSPGSAEISPKVQGKRRNDLHRRADSIDPSWNAHVRILQGKGRRRRIRRRGRTIPTSPEGHQDQSGGSTHKKAVAIMAPKYKIKKIKKSTRGICLISTRQALSAQARSEERRVGKECRSRWS